MLSKLLSDSFWRGIDRFIIGRVSVWDEFTEGTGACGSKIGSDGEEDVDSILVSSVGVDDSSGFASDFFTKNTNRAFLL